MLLLALFFPFAVNCMVQCHWAEEDIPKFLRKNLLLKKQILEYTERKEKHHGTLPGTLSLVCTVEESNSFSVCVNGLLMTQHQ